MEIHQTTALRGELEARRERLASAISAAGDSGQLVRLLGEVDAALERFDHGTFGLCEVCHDPIETDLLMADPLVRTCLDHLTPEERSSLERDLNLAGTIQRQLLPERELVVGEWQVCHHYRPAGAVSGDYCDVIRLPSPGGGLLFALGDVSGKGVAASMLMAHLAAIFRSLAELGLPVRELVERANRLFCQGTPAAHYATLVCGAARAGGQLVLCNAGHLPPLHLHLGGVTRVAGGGLPLGLFCAVEQREVGLLLEPGDCLLLCTDGLTESRDSSDEEYGLDRLQRLLERLGPGEPRELIAACLADLDAFRGRGGPLHDDLTLMVLRRSVGERVPQA
jgi:sigma-B regulation protein RsbU (phosphoserine phosphatase)